MSTRTLLITAALLVAAVAFLPWPLAQRITDSPWSGPGDLAHVVADAFVIANVQGAFAPLSSVLSFLPQVSGTEVAVAARAVRLDVSAASLAPSTSALVCDFAVYHAVLAVAATCLVIAPW